MEVKDIQNEVFEGYFSQIIDKKILTIEYATVQLPDEIYMREFTAHEQIVSEKDAPVFTGTNNLQDDMQTQIISIHGIKMTEAGIIQLIYVYTKIMMNSQLSTNHEMRIIADEGQQSRKLVIISKTTNEVLKSGGGITTLLGDESSKKVEIALKNVKLPQRKNASTSIISVAPSLITDRQQQQIIWFVHTIQQLRIQLILSKLKQSAQYLGGNQQYLVITSVNVELWLRRIKFNTITTRSDIPDSILATSDTNARSKRILNL
ncbi:MAG: hypothetical protein EZS28_033138 [Streblomastix strix]|uniref:Uncharacterized protein n=1 Tax=Streblomastix strix TaxID=222440 RepID=A0A5J4UNG6_9EUKA|nr:MAG: hypothetical protein EZS28_033138 [Streblomastix strix]